MRGREPPFPLLARAAFLFRARLHLLGAQRVDGAARDREVFLYLVFPAAGGCIAGQRCIATSMSRRTTCLTIARPPLQERRLPADGGVRPQIALLRPSQYALGDSVRELAVAPLRASRFARQSHRQRWERGGGRPLLPGVGGSRRLSP